MATKRARKQAPRAHKHQQKEREGKGKKQSDRWEKNAGGGERQGKVKRKTHTKQEERKRERGRQTSRDIGGRRARHVSQEEEREKRHQRICSLFFLFNIVISSGSIMRSLSFHSFFYFLGPFGNLAGRKTNKEKARSQQARGKRKRQERDTEERAQQGIRNILCSCLFRLFRLFFSGSIMRSCFVPYLPNQKPRIKLGSPGKGITDSQTFVPVLS